jgi:phosphoribosylformylglycinamidine synthase
MPCRVVIPRLGTISPWASKATDIAKNCGFAAVTRIERGILYHIAGVGGVEQGLLRGLMRCCTIEWLKPYSLE